MRKRFVLLIEHLLIGGPRGERHLGEFLHCYKNKSEMGASNSKNMDKLLDVSIELKMQAKMINKDSIKSANQATMQKKQIKEVAHS